ncbi:MAG: hypothetical protein WCS73_01280 [Lentisphaeria bacterium]
MMQHKHSLTILIATLFLLFLASCLITIYTSLQLNYQLTTLQGLIQNNNLQTCKIIYDYRELKQKKQTDKEETLITITEEALTTDKEEALTDKKEALINRAQSEFIKESNKINHIFAAIYLSLKHTVWFIVFLAICDFILAIRAFYQVESYLAKPLAQIRDALKKSMQEDIAFKTIPQQASPILNEIGELCNQMFRYLQRMQDSHYLKVNMLQKTTMQLIEIPEKPIVVLTSGSELLIANALARDYLLGDAGDRFLQYLLEAASKDAHEFDSHGRRYSLTRIEPKKQEAKYCVVNIYEFEFKGIVQEEGPVLHSLSQEVKIKREKNIQLEKKILNAKGPMKEKSIRKKNK